MTTEQTLLPGKELDHLVAAKLGWRKGKSYALLVPGNEDSNYWYNQEGYKTECRVDDAFANLHAWSPSTNWEAAGKLVEKAKNRGHKFVLEIWSDRKYHVAFFALDGGLLPDNCSDTAPHAICLAFLALPDDEVLNGKD